MIPWEKLGKSAAPDGEPIELRRRGAEFRIWAGQRELMSSEDEPSSRSLAELGCAHLAPASDARVLVGGLGMGFTLREALDRVGPGGLVEVAELVPAVVEWNRSHLGDLAGRPLDDPRARVLAGDVGVHIGAAKGRYDAILLDVDNGPIHVAHKGNDALYSDRGIHRAHDALKPGGMLGVWSLADDKRFTARLKQRGLLVEVHRVFGSRRDRGREHVIWTARRRP